MKEQLISFGTAKLAKEKGFNLPTFYACKHWIYEDVIRVVKEPKSMLSYLRTYGTDEEVEMGINFNKLSGNCMNISVPTKSLLQKWFRDNHKIHIAIHINERGKYYWRILGSNGAIVLSYSETDINGEYICQDTFEDALEEGLLNALIQLK